MISNPIPRFLFGLIIIMPCCLALWWFILRDYLLITLEYLVRLIVELLLADSIITLSANDNVWFLHTTLSPIDNPLNLLAIPISTTRFSISFPLLWGLILATPAINKLKQLFSGTAIIFISSTCIALLLIQFKLALAINHQPILTEIPQGSFLLALPYSDTAYYLMAVGRQLAMLVLPTLAPLIVWCFLNRRFIRVVLLEGWLSRESQKDKIATSSSKSQ